MVIGLDKFRAAFTGLSDCYVIIGGTACDIILQGTAMNARATKDIDMILVAEKLTDEFVSVFWDFIREGGYKPNKRTHREGESPRYELYRFVDPISGYPLRIELLSRYSEILKEPSGYPIAPIPVGEDLSSLSAIMLDEAYYQLTIEHSEIMDGIRIASPIALICLKVKAFLNLTAERAAGKHINTGDIKKHRNDVLKLVATTAFNDVAIPVEILEAVQEYADQIQNLLPDAGLEAALGASSEDVRVYLDTLREVFSKPSR